MYLVFMVLGLFLLVACGIGTVFVEGVWPRLRLIVLGASLFAFFVQLGGALLWVY